MVNTILKLAGNVLEYVTIKEKRKYQDEIIEIKKQWYEENNKHSPDFAVLDNLEYRTRLLGDAISAEASK